MSVAYGASESSAEFRVWMPEKPLRVSMESRRLGQVKGWRVERKGKRRNRRSKYNR